MTPEPRPFGHLHRQMRSPYCGCGGGDGVEHDVSTKTRSLRQRSPAHRRPQLHPGRGAAARHHAALRVEDGRDVPPLRDCGLSGPGGGRGAPRRRRRGRLRGDYGQTGEGAR